MTNTINTGTTAAITDESILDSKELRDKMSDRIEVLDKVKQLLLIPEMECMTVQQVADYYEVPYETIKSQYKYNKDEFDNDGVHFKQLSDFKSLVGLNSTDLKMAQRRGFLELTFPDGTIVAINNKGVKCFPKRAVLRMGMLLRDSRIAKEIRTQLLNVFEHATTEQRVAEIDEEETIIMDMMRAFRKRDIVGVLTAANKQDELNKRFINRLEQRNNELSDELANTVNLNKELHKDNQKIAEQNSNLVLENEVLATDVLKWTDRATANRLVRVLAGSLHKGFSDTFNLVYRELLYKYSISLKGRAKLRKTKHPLISYIRDDEWIYVYKVVAAICNKSHIVLTQLFEKAKIDVSTLDLSE
ncbi:MAG: hypothetical protein NC299_16720 [Lachnospiraceae bacterium]|nr:hypothetical protein [Lachnospiraceae bacterium]